MNPKEQDNPIDLRSDDAFASVCMRFFLDELSNDEFLALETELNDNPSRRRTFVELAIQIEQMTEVMGQHHATRAIEEGIDQDAISFEIMEELVALSMESRRQREQEAALGRARTSAEDRSVKGPIERSPRSKRVIVIPKPVVWLAGAAALVLLALLVYSPNDSSRPDAAHQPQETTPAVVTAAVITGSYQAKWADVPADDRMELGKRHHLLEGSVALRLDSGVTAVVQAPAIFELTGTNDMRLLQGRLAAEVPEPAQGFQVNTPHLLLTDLGTAFGVEVDADRQISQAHVFSGRVIANNSQALSEHDDGRPIDMTQGHGVRASINASARRSVVNPGRYLRRLEDAPFKLETSDNVRFLDDAPVSLLPNKLQSDQWVHVFLERSGVSVSDPIAASIIEPGVYNQYGNAGVPRRLPVPVDSYLVHLDSVVGSDGMVVHSGQMTFPRPVVGVLCTERELSRTDHLFAREGIALHRTGDPKSAVGLDGVLQNPNPEQVDVVELSDDRRTITFRLHAGHLLDEFRVLIESQEDTP